MITEYRMIMAKVKDLETPTLQPVPSVINHFLDVNTCTDIFVQYTRELQKLCAISVVES